MLGLPLLIADNLSTFRSTPARECSPNMGAMALLRLGGTVTHCNLHGPEPILPPFSQLPWVLITWDHLW